MDKTDATGLAFGFDDAIAGLVGGLIGTAIQGYKDIYSLATGGDGGTYGETAGAFTSGAIVGVGAVNVPETGGVSPVVASAAAYGAAAGGAGNLVKQGVDIHNGDQASGVNIKEAAVSAAVGAVAGAVTEGALPNARIPGLSSGRANMNAVGQGVRTKIANGTASAMSTRTAAKAAVGSQAAGAYKSAAGVAVDAAQAKTCQSNALQNVCH